MKIHNISNRIFKGESSWIEDKHNSFLTKNLLFAKLSPINTPPSIQCNSSPSTKSRSIPTKSRSSTKSSFVPSPNHSPLVPYPKTTWEKQSAAYPLQVYSQRRRSIVQSPKVYEFEPILEIPDISEEQNMAAI